MHSNKHKGKGHLELQDLLKVQCPSGEMAIRIRERQMRINSCSNMTEREIMLQELVVVIELEHLRMNQRRIWHLNMDTKGQRKPVDLLRIIITNNSRLQRAAQVHMRSTRRSELKMRLQQMLLETSLKVRKINVLERLRKLLLKLLGTIRLRKGFVMKKRLRQTLEIESLTESWQKERLILEPKRRPWLTKEKLMKNK